MQKKRFQAWVVSLSDIYSLKDDDAKGRLISLGSALTTALYNVFITGVFYTGFLSMYGMSITSVGIISFIPYIGSCFSVFSSVILERIRKRKRILILSKVFFYSLYIKYSPNASYIYGGLAAICLIMLWLYFCMIIFLCGAEVNKLWAAYKEDRDHRK